MAAALCHFPSSPSHRPLSKLLSNSRSQSIPPTKDLISNTSPNFACGYHPRRWSSTLSVTASTTAFAPPEHSESTSLGDITRLDFPILRQKVNDHDLVYMDSGATSQKPNYMLNSLREYYESSNSNVHRGVHYLSQKATTAYENAREKVAKFINSSDHREIVFTRNATEAINLVANSWGDANLKSGDEILLTVAEHHSCIVPWQIVAQKKGAILKYIGLTLDEVPDIEQLKKALSKKTKIVVTHHVSNTLGSVLPIEDIISWSHDVGAKVLVDACQSVPHMVVDVQKLDADFLVASSHKMCGPTGIGFLYGKINLLSSMPPFLGGGEMIADVFQDYSTYAEPPSRFEAGTPAIAEAIGLGAAIEYLSGIGMKQIHDYERELAEYLYYSLTSIPNVRVYGPAPSEVTHRAALCSFNVENIHPTDIATILNEEHGVAIRSGHHCAQPLHRYLGVNASARASLYFYNTKAEVDLFIEALKSTISFFNPCAMGDRRPRRARREDAAEHRADHLDTARSLEPVSHLDLLREWPVTCERFIGALDAAGVGSLRHLGYITLDSRLLTALVERWSPTTNTFILPVGEMTITLEDVAIILGVRIDGPALIGPLGIGPGATWATWPDCCDSLLGQHLVQHVVYENLMNPNERATYNMGQASAQTCLPLRWLRWQFARQSYEGISDLDFTRSVRAYILYLIGCFLMPDTSGSEVHLQWLPLLEDLDRFAQLSLGGAVLAHIYRELAESVRPSKARIVGCLHLMQIWAWEHFHVGRPVLYVPGWEDVDGKPLGYRWNDGWTRNRPMNTVIYYRNELDTLQQSHVIWEPYTDACIEILPAICRE